MVSARLDSAAPSAGPDLSRFRFHTGGRPRRLLEDEACPLLFRDIGPAGMLLFLTGRIKRLAGPLAPILYLRSADYTEPYADAEEIGRLAFLQPRDINPWTSGTPDVFIADVAQPITSHSIVFVPTQWTTPAKAGILATLPDGNAVREHLGGPIYDETLNEAIATTTSLIAEQHVSEQRAHPVRSLLQKGSVAQRQRIRESMASCGVSERDLCSAWHHIPRSRRVVLDKWLHQFCRDNG